MLRPSHRTTLLALALLIAAGLSFRLAYAWEHPLTGDEVISNLIASGHRADWESHIPKTRAPAAAFTRLLDYDPQSSFGEVYACIAGPLGKGHSPLYYLTLRAWMGLFGNSVFAVRSLSLLFSFLSIGLVVALSRRVLGNASTLTATALLALSPFCLYFSPMARPYPMAMFLSLLSAWMMLQLLEHTGKKQIGWGIGFVACSAASLYTIIHSVFPFVFQMVWLLMIDWRNRRHWIVCIALGIGVSLLFLPWLPSLALHLNYNANQLAPFHGENSAFGVIKKLFYHDLLNPLTRSFITHHVSDPLVRGSRLLLLIVGGSLTVFGWWKLPTRHRTAWGAGLLIYLGLNLFADTRAAIWTLSMPKLYFFLWPMILLLWVAALTGLPRLPARLLTGFLVAWYGVGAAWILLEKPRYEDPFELNEFQSVLREHTQPPMHGLYLFNYDRSRWLFTTTHLAQTIEPTAEALHVPREEVSTVDLGPLEHVDYIAVFNQSQRNFGHFRYSQKDLLHLDARLTEVGYHRVAATVPSYNEMWLYLPAANHVP